jgi:hypothetical protein
MSRHPRILIGKKLQLSVEAHPATRRALSAGYAALSRPTYGSSPALQEKGRHLSCFAVRCRLAGEEKVGGG